MRAKADGETLPWPQMMQSAFRLGIAPQIFWEMTPAEWLALLGAHEFEEGISRQDLQQMMRRSPDATAPGSRSQAS